MALTEKDMDFSRNVSAIRAHFSLFSQTLAEAEADSLNLRWFARRRFVQNETRRIESTYPNFMKAVVGHIVDRACCKTPVADPYEILVDVAYPSPRT